MMLDRDMIRTIEDILRRGETAEVKMGPNGPKVFEMRRKLRSEQRSPDKTGERHGHGK